VYELWKQEQKWHLVETKRVLQTLIRRRFFNKGHSPLPIACSCAPALFTLITMVIHNLRHAYTQHFLYALPSTAPPLLISSHISRLCMLFCLVLLSVSRLSFCPFSGLVCDQLLKRLSACSAESVLPEGHPESKSEQALLGGYQPGGVLPTQASWEGTIASGATFLAN